MERGGNIPTPKAEEQPSQPQGLTQATCFATPSVMSPTQANCEICYEIMKNLDFLVSLREQLIQRLLMCQDMTLGQFYWLAVELRNDLALLQESSLNKIPRKFDYSCLTQTRS